MAINRGRRRGIFMVNLGFVDKDDEARNASVAVVF
jgi:hypothetical protein